MSQGLYDSALATFFTEAREMLQQIEDTLIALEADPADGEAINALFRAAHTIKGSAGLFGLDQVVAFTHHLESVLDRVRNGELAISHELSDVLLQGGDVIQAMLALAEGGRQDAEEDARVASLAQEVEHGLSAYMAACPASGAAVSPRQQDAPAAGQAAGTWHISLRFGSETFRNGFDPLSVIQYLGTLGELSSILTLHEDVPALEALDAEACHLGFELDIHTAASRAEIEAAFEFVREDCLIDLQPTQAQAGALPAPAQDVAASAAPSPAGAPRHPAVREGRTEESRFLRVPADRLDELISLVGELVICGAGANLLAQNLHHPQLIETTQRMSSLVESIRNGTLALRMVQIGETFARFRRVVRDTAAELCKEIQLSIDGAETELDKSVVEKIGDPLMHLVRNAIDHGIEPAEARLAAGKPAQGTLTLAAHHDSGNIVIRVSDDGRGLDPEKLLAKARERGLVGPNQVLSEPEKLNLIFLPGFSTADKVTNLSGRGVGMDVVRKNIEALRGTVLLHSEVGQGATFEIRLPLTLAIIDGFLVRVGSGYFVVPLHAVIECIDAPAGRLAPSGHPDGWSGSLDLRGEVLPYLELRRVFDVAEPPPARRSIVVVKTGETRAGLLVDQLMGEYQTVIKPLGKLFGHLRGIAGSTVLGSGEVALILDVHAMVTLAGEHETRTTQAA